MPICLPSLNQNFDGQTCTASGWGLTKDRTKGGNDSNPDLLKVDLPIVPYDECRRDYIGVQHVDRNTMICAGNKEGGKSTCQGDSGGPLQCPRSDGLYVLAGLTSWATICAAPGQPTVFSRVSTQLPWIQQTAGATP
ncbi:trypsin-1-like [Ixodes scapularis]|uniref:trypsin-1-like n=1 Tax=Ixodes scapularis TaxID=6945 RepID=UPI001C3936D7|nr:trypsin-1-like [Ixodes scapularis]